MPLLEHLNKEFVPFLLSKLERLVILDFHSPSPKKIELAKNERWNLHQVCPLKIVKLSSELI